FFALVDWLNAHSASAEDLGPERGILPLRSLKVLNRTTHGWMEFVEHAPLPDADGARRYYRRVGMMLSLIHALDGVDFHLANVIASGEEPVIVDLETLLHAVPRPWDSEMADSADLQALGSIEGSVLRSGLLPS